MRLTIRRRLVVIMACGAAFAGDAGSTQLAAQEDEDQPSVRFPTYLRVFYEYQDFGGSSGSTYGIGAGLEAGPTTGELVALRVERFDFSDQAFGADLYTRVWPRAYVYTRTYFAPEPDILPERELHGELFQGFGEGWEASAGGRWLDYPATDLTLLVGSLAKYLPHWYLRARGSYVLDVEGVGYSFLARRYFGGDPSARGANHVQLIVGMGDEIVEFRPTTTGGVVIDVRDSRFAILGTRLFPPGSAVGLAASVGAYDHEGLERRWIYSVGVSYRR